MKKMDLKEFREKGFLQEANRLFFHPLGLALAVKVNESTGEVELGGVFDAREDPEGWVFEGVLDADMATNVALERSRHLSARRMLPVCDATGVQIVPRAALDPNSNQTGPPATPLPRIGEEGFGSAADSEL